MNWQFTRSENNAHCKPMSSFCVILLNDCFEYYFYLLIRALVYFFFNLYLLGEVCCTTEKIYFQQTDTFFLSATILYLLACWFRIFSLVITFNSHVYLHIEAPGF